MKKKLRNYGLVNYHRMVANFQRETYNLHRKSVLALKDKLMIVVDYKQKISIGMGPRQVNSEYRNQQLKICLGI